MTEDKNKEHKDRKKVSDEELEDVAGGIQGQSANGAFLNRKKPVMEGVTQDPWDK